MFISRIVIRNFRNFALLDVRLEDGVTTVIGENNTGKTNLLHALRLALDSNLSSQYRQLIEHDIHSSVDISSPQQVIVSVEFSNYSENENQCALVGCWEVQEGIARLSYRFRPKRVILEAIESGDREDGDMTLEDYNWELTGGGNNDPATVQHNEPLGDSIRFSDLQQFQVVFLQALRDVERDQRQTIISPLGRLFAVSDIPQQEKEDLVAIIRSANQEVSEKPTIQNIGDTIRTAFRQTTGDAFAMEVRLGMADPSFSSISRALNVLLSNDSLSDFETRRNGLGLNNILYISMLLEYFRRRISNPRTAGQLLLIEEPEAHLHPQLQRVLYAAIREESFQTIITTHSTHISSQAPFRSVISLTNSGNPEIISTVPASGGQFTNAEIADLERYLDATRSTLLYARKVILVEGPAELFLIPGLVKQVMHIDLDRLGISVIPIYGVHFDVYAKLFVGGALPKKCAIIADGDLKVGEDVPTSADEDEPPEPPNLDSLENEFVKVYKCRTTFERALVSKKRLRMLAAAAEECGAHRVAEKLQNGYDLLTIGGSIDEEQKRLLKTLRTSVLNTAKRFGKARFAQVAAKYVTLAESIPKYIKDAINWLVEE